jgi:hypothetical protein
MRTTCGGLRRAVSPSDGLALELVEAVATVN